MGQSLQRGGTIVGYPDSEPVAADLLFTLPSDIAIPAALGGVIDQDNRQVDVGVDRRGSGKRSHDRRRGCGSRESGHRGGARRPRQRGRRVASYFEWAQDLPGLPLGGRNSFTTDWKRRCARPSTTSGLVTSNLKSRCRETAIAVGVERIAEAH